MKNAQEMPKFSTNCPNIQQKIQKIPGSTLFLVLAVQIFDFFVEHLLAKIVFLNQVNKKSYWYVIFDSKYSSIDKKKIITWLLYLLFIFLVILFLCSVKLEAPKEEPTLLVFKNFLDIYLFAKQLTQNLQPWNIIVLSASKYLKAQKISWNSH